MAASIVVPARTGRGGRGSAARAAARTAPRGTGLAPVIPMPLVDAALPADLPGLAPDAPSRPRLAVVPPAARRRAARSRRLVASLVTAALLAVAVVAVAGGALDRSEPVAAGHVVLQPGETLWDVAVRSAPNGVDPRRQLDTLRRLNGFGSGPLDAWTVVLIPAL